jgi:hypothetical protein
MNSDTASRRPSILRSADAIAWSANNSPACILSSVAEASVSLVSGAEGFFV